MHVFFLLLLSVKIALEFLCPTIVRPGRQEILRKQRIVPTKALRAQRRMRVTTVEPGEYPSQPGTEQTLGANRFFGIDFALLFFAFALPDLGRRAVAVGAGPALDRKPDRQHQR